MMLVVYWEHWGILGSCLKSCGSPALYWECWWYVGSTGHILGLCQKTCGAARVVLGAVGPHWDGAGHAYPGGFCSISPFYFVISPTVAPSRAQTSAFQYGPVLPSIALCPLQDFECDPGLQDDVTMAQSPIPVYPTSSQCLSSAPSAPSGTTAALGAGMGQGLLLWSQWGHEDVTSASAGRAVACPGVSPGTVTPGTASPDGHMSHRLTQPGKSLPARPVQPVLGPHLVPSPELRVHLQNSWDTSRDGHSNPPRALPIPELPFHGEIPAGSMSEKGEADIDSSSANSVYLDFMYLLLHFCGYRVMQSPCFYVPLPVSYQFHPGFLISRVPCF
nr:uncharacterized protein LOC121468121 isoform X2 [Taeniopygia guttata]